MELENECPLCLGHFSASQKAGSESTLMKHVVTSLAKMLLANANNTNAFHLFS